MTTPVDPWGQFPEYTALVRARDHVASLTFPPAPSVIDAQRAILERFIAGENLTGAQVVEEMARAHLGSAPLEAALHLRVEAVHDFRNRIENFERTHRDEALAWLNGELAELFATVTTLAGDLADIDTAEHAVTDGAQAAEAWRALGPLVDRYRSIRGWQREITADAYGSTVTNMQRDLPRHGIVRQARDYSPLTDEVAGVEASLHVDRGGSQMVGTDAPWPTNDDRAFLLWCARNDATPWVPTTRELHAELEAHRDAVAQARADREQPERARRRKAAAAAEARSDRLLKNLQNEANVQAQMEAAGWSTSRTSRLFEDADA
jgi:hypothetical protein